jgi:hypothetical protein
VYVFTSCGGGHCGGCYVFTCNARFAYQLYVCRQHKAAVMSYLYCRRKEHDRAHAEKESTLHAEEQQTMSSGSMDTTVNLLAFMFRNTWVCRPYIIYLHVFHSIPPFECRENTLNSSRLLTASSNSSISLHKSNTSVSVME